TDIGVKPMTPEYASPEQILGKPITPASDIYSLGVLLYELIGGCRPAADIREIEGRFASQADPLRPSAAMMSQGRITPGNKRCEVALIAEEISSRRGTTPSELRRQLAGDLDTIVLKAMRVQPERRYASAQELSDDLERHLSCLPITARKEVALYRTGRFLRRHKTVVLVSSITATLVAVLMLSIGGLSHMLGRPSPIRSIAVLPLRNLSNDSEQEYFSEGLTDELITHLASLEGLQVISHTSVKQYKDTRKPLTQIAKELNV